jgi:AcrR family transcriptional regulator
MARPRSTRAHAAVLKAACTLFAERGIDVTSMDAIAATSKVSKATIYKHWEDKDALCLEVMAYLHGTETALPDTNTGDLREDLLAVLTRQPPKELAAVRERLMPQLMAVAGRNPRLGAMWRARVFEPPRVQILRAIRRSIDRGELPAAVNVELAVALLLGPQLYLHIRKLSTGEAPSGAPAYVVDALLRSQGFVPASTPLPSPPRSDHARTVRRVIKKGRA